MGAPFFITGAAWKDASAGDAERWWAVAVGARGLAAFAAGALVTRAPSIDRPTDAAVTELVQRRRAVLVGSVLSITGAALLL